MRIGNPEVIAHRGHGSCPENTMRAFRAGHAAGADRIEFDIQPSKDGDYIVIHDPTVDRTTNGTGQVCDLTTAQIRSLDAGKGEKLPLFTEVIDWAVQNDVKLDIELKHPHNGDEVRLASMIRDSGLRDPLVMSFDGAFMERFENYAPDLKTAILVHERPLFDKSIRAAGVGAVAGAGLALATGLGVLPFAGAMGAGLAGGALAGFAVTRAVLRRKDMDRDVDMHIPGKRLISKHVIENAHAHGKECGVYTIDDSAKGDKLKSWGIDAIISNFPERHR